MRAIFIAVGLGVLAAVAGGAAPGPNGWKAGVAEVRITPPLGTPMAGFSARKSPSAGVHDDLFVKALVVERPGAAVALVTAELIGVDRETVGKIREAAARRTALAPGNILISATHTHSGPVAAGSYKEFFAGAAEDAIAQAWEARRPARIASGAATHRGWVGMNRRRLESGFSPVDRQVPVLEIADERGRPVAILFNYSCHAACLGPDNLRISADWPYFTSERIRAQLGRDVKVLFFQGTEGNVNTGYSAGLSAIGVPIATRTFEYAQEVGERLGDAILAALPGLAPAADGAVEARQEKVNLDYYIPTTLEEADAALARAREAVRAAEERQAPLVRIQAARVEAAYAGYSRERTARNLKAGPGPYAAEIQALRIGEAGFVSFPGEFFVEIGLAVKHSSPFRTTFCLGLANDGISYVPTAEAFPEGGYEVSVARFAPSTAARWQEAAARLLAGLAGPRR